MKAKFWTLIALLAVITTVASACVVPTVQAPAQPPAAAENWWAKAAQEAGCTGVTLHGISESTPPSNYAKDAVGKMFEQESGIKVELETTSWDEQYNKAIKDMEAKTGIYDFVYI